MPDKVDPIDDEDLLYDPDAKGQLGRIVSHRGKEHNGRVHYCLFGCYPPGLHRRDDVKRQIIGGNLGLTDRSPKLTGENPLQEHRPFFLYGATVSLERYDLP